MVRASRLRIWNAVPVLWIAERLMVGLLELVKADSARRRAARMASVSTVRRVWMDRSTPRRAVYLVAVTNVSRVVLAHLAPLVRVSHPAAETINASIRAHLVAIRQITAVLPV